MPISSDSSESTSSETSMNHSEILHNSSDDSSRNNSSDDLLLNNSGDLMHSSFASYDPYEHEPPVDYQIDSETGIATTFRNGRRNGFWETNVTDSMIYDGGAMSFPIELGIVIPERLFTIRVRVKRTRCWYDMQLSYNSRNWSEKYLEGEGWRNFLDEQNVAVGDVLDWYIECDPVVCTVSIRRNKKGKKGGKKNAAEKKGGKMVGKKLGSSHAKKVV